MFQANASMLKTRNQGAKARMDANEEFGILLSGLVSALQNFYRLDADLLRLGVNEPSLVGNFYRYFHEAVYSQFRDERLRIDLEYDKVGQEEAQKPRTGANSGRLHMRPDMVVHYRGNPQRNLCMFEFKLHDSKEDFEEDRDKLRECVDPEWLGYHFGCFVVFGETIERCKSEWFADGKFCAMTYDEMSARHAAQRPDLWCKVDKSGKMCLG
ncbi:MAG: hypothetical protein K6F50_08725 [Kiritimatiellae bacterium]|nr:hypothetical protein [Kiritimatiellia bacterium]